MCDKGKEWSQKTIPDGHKMTIVRPTFFGRRLLFTTRNFVFGMNNVVAEYQISSSVACCTLMNTGACASTVPVEGPVSASPFPVNMVELTLCCHHHNLANALTLYTPVRATVFFKFHDT